MGNILTAEKLLTKKMVSTEQAAAMIQALRQQVEELADTLDRSRQETADLRQQTDRSIAHLQEQCDRTRPTVGGSAGEHDHMRLIDEKVNRPPIFDGNRKEIRGWSRSVKAYLDSKYPGFRKILTIIERANARSNDQDLVNSGWKWALAANKSLYNMLISYTKGEAQIMLENSDPDEGFECWRKLIQHYDPQGGDNELTTINTLLSVPRCKRLNDIITTVEAWEREWAQYQDRTKESLPERWKVSLLLRMIPVENEREIRLRYVKSKDITYAELRENLFAWVQQNATGAVAMHIGSMSAEDAAHQRHAETNRYAMLAEMDRRDNGDEDDDDNLENFEEINLLKTKYEDELNVLRQKGQGKGGKKGGGRKGAPRGAGKTTPPKFEGLCGYCKIKGHKAKDCRKRIADQKKKDAGALDADLGCIQHEEDFDDNSLFMPLRSLDIEGDDDDDDERGNSMCGECDEDDEDANHEAEDVPLYVVELPDETAKTADERLDLEMSSYIYRKEVEQDRNEQLTVEERACVPTIHGTPRASTATTTTTNTTAIAHYSTHTPEPRTGFGSSPNPGPRASPMTAGTSGSTRSTAERFREQLDRLAESFSVVEAGSIPLPESLRTVAEPPGLGVEMMETGTQTDIQLGKSTWVVSISNERHRHDEQDEQVVEKFAQPGSQEAEQQEAGYYEEPSEEDSDNCLQVDCIDCEEEPEFKHPDEYEYRREKLVEYGYESPVLTPDRNFGKARRRAAKKMRAREQSTARTRDDGELGAISKPDNDPVTRVDEHAPIAVTKTVSCVDELAPITDATAAFGCQSVGSQPSKSTNPSLPTSLSLSVDALVSVMIPAIVLAAACICTEVVEFDPNHQQDPQPLFVAEKETVKKSIGQRLREKIQSMVRIRKGFTVDSGAADHVMPLGWLAWIVVTASLGSLSGVNFISATGAKIPNKGEQKVRFMTPEGTWATWVFQVAGINKPLVSVSKLIADGWRVVFDQDRSYLLHKRTGHTIDLKCERGIFTVDAYVEPASGSPDFTRQA